MDVKIDRSSQKQAVYVIIGIDENAQKDVLGFWINPSESAEAWMKIFDELQSRGVEFVTLTTSELSRLTQPERIASPAWMVLGCDSPVSARMSSLESPWMTVPSTGAFSPGLMSTISPGMTVSGVTSS